MDLFIFDFDDTLAITDSRVKVIEKDTQKETMMTSREFAYYPFNPSEMDVDFSDFARANGTLIKDTVEMMQQAMLDGADVFIVTARSIAEPVTRFLESQLIKAPPVIATAGSEGKSPWLASKLEQNHYDRVIVYEDCEKNIRSLKNTVLAFNAATEKSVQYSGMCIQPDQTVVQKESRWRSELILNEDDFRNITRNFLQKTW